MERDLEQLEEIVDLGAASVETQGPGGPLSEFGVITQALGIQAE